MCFYHVFRRLCQTTKNAKESQDDVVEPYTDWKQEFFLPTEVIL
jgi:hypothetical protein